MNIDIYTDGSLMKKNGKILCGYGIYFPNGEYKNISRNFTHEPITNNRAELYAILKTIILCNIINKSHPIKSINIYTDSEYSVKTINKWYNDWKRSGKDYKNPDIIDELIQAKNLALYKINVIHVRAHTNKMDAHSVNNDKADELAKNGANRI